MTLFGWFKQKEIGPGPAVRQWRAEWARVLEGPGTGDERLRDALRRLAANEPDVELETEMLDALEAEHGAVDESLVRKYVDLLS